MDVFDGVFPSVELSVSSSETEKELYEEERRLYYVGITRAKKELYLFSLADKKCSFVSETVPKIPPLQPQAYQLLHHPSLQLVQLQLHLK